MTSLVISEVFGPTIQGEGPAAGRVAAFVRLGGCNLTCSWCDTAYTWDASRFDLRAELRRVSVAELVELVDKHLPPAGLVVITGGEPLLQQGAAYGLAEFCAIIAGRGIGVHMETNGTIEPHADVAEFTDLFVVSPKLAHAGMGLDKTIRFGVLRHFAALALRGQAALKVVVRDEADVARAATIARQAGWPRSACWVMPEGTTPGAVTARLKAITPAALLHGLNVTGRQHVMVWGSERGH